MAGKIEDFSEVVEGGQLGDMWDRMNMGKKNEDFHCGWRTTLVFWNVVQCPVLSSAIPRVKPNINSALDRMGLHAAFQIYAYGDKLDQKDDFRKAGIFYSLDREHLLLDAEIKDSSEMAVDLIVFAKPSCDRPSIIMVIPEPDPDSELHRVLKCMKSRNHDVLLVKPPDDDESGSLFDFAESIFDCTRGLDGGEPISRPRCKCIYS